MLKSGDNKEFCGRNGNISLRIVIDLENPWKDLESSYQKSVGTLTLLKMINTSLDIDVYGVAL